MLMHSEAPYSLVSGQLKARSTAACVRRQVLSPGPQPHRVDPEASGFFLLG